jgi:hypothetical protein
MIKQKILVLLSALALLLNAQAQNSTSSPFSIFGIGEIETRDFGRTTGMGNVGIGCKSPNFLNRHNPAGLSGIDTLRFVLDVSVAVKLSEFITSGQNGRTTDFNFKNLAVGLRLSKRWTSSVGLSPYSNVGYQMTDREQQQGGEGYTSVHFSGNGGINKFYWAHAIELFRGFSIGVTSSYLFGNFTQNIETNIFSINNTFNVNKLYFDFGMQYSHWFQKHTNITVGGVYGYQSKMSVQQTQMISSYGMIERNQRLPDRKSFVPESYGAGFSIFRNKNSSEWIFAADYHLQKWSVDGLRHKSLKYTDSHLYSVGMQLTPNNKTPENFLQFMRYQLGASYNQSYLKVNGHQSEDYSVSLGVGLPFRVYLQPALNYVNISVTVGESGTGQRGGITERYVLFTVNLSLIEAWRKKYQYD